MISKRIYLLFISLCILLSVAPAAMAAGSNVQGDTWQFAFTPYIWGTEMQGTSTVARQTTDIDMSFSDILSNLNLGAMLDFRAEKGPLATQINFLWADLEMDANVLNTNLKVKPVLWVVEWDGSYRFADNWEFILGVRYYDIEIGMDATGGQTFSVSGSEQWVDPLVGIGFSKSMCEKWSFKARGDMGGFGTGSDLSWQLSAIFDYRFGKTSSLVFGYRHLDLDYETGSGLKYFALDTYLSGPIVGVKFRF